MNVYFLVANHRIYFWMALISTVFVWIFFFSGGYQKIASFGQDISRLDYRLIGFNDTSRVLNAILQISRRLTLPFCVIYFFLLRGYFPLYSRKFSFYIFLSLITGIIITLDRGPIMLLVVMFFYISYCTTKNPFKVLAIIITSLAFIVLLGGTITFIQYNIQEFSFSDVVSTGFNFLIRRAIMAPNFVPIELSYGIFDYDSEKLYLVHSRLLALFTGNYVGTLEDNSLFVGPVGAVADIWRNLGIFGIILIGFLIGIYFSAVDVLIKRVDPIIQVAGSFTVITLVFYFLYGTFFSQGVFLQLIFLIFILRISRKDGQRFIR